MECLGTLQKKVGLGRIRQIGAGHVLSKVQSPVLATGADADNLSECRVL